MRVLPICLLLALASAPLLAQAPATQSHSDDLGFSYGVPAGWEVVAIPAPLENVDGEKNKGISCSRVALTARHGSPASVIVVAALPFDCFGRKMTGKELPEFAAETSNGLKATFNLSSPVNGVYSLGKHSVWIERAKGSLKGRPEVNYTVETACTVLQKAAVCWMTLAVDDAALKTFESNPVTLDGEAPTALAPADAFQKKPK